MSRWQRIDRAAVEAQVGVALAASCDTGTLHTSTASPSAITAGEGPSAVVSGAGAKFFAVSAIDVAHARAYRGRRRRSLRTRRGRRGGRGGCSSGYRFRPARSVVVACAELDLYLSRRVEGNAFLHGALGCFVGSCVTVTATPATSFRADRVVISSLAPPPTFVPPPLLTHVPLGNVTDA